MGSLHFRQAKEGITGSEVDCRAKGPRKSGGISGSSSQDPGQVRPESKVRSEWWSSHPSRRRGKEPESKQQGGTQEAKGKREEEGFGENEMVEPEEQRGERAGQDEGFTGFYFKQGRRRWPYGALEKALYGILAKGGKPGCRVVAQEGWAEMAGLLQELSCQESEILEHIRTPRDGLHKFVSASYRNGEVWVGFVEEPYRQGRYEYFPDAEEGHQEQGREKQEETAGSAGQQKKEPHKKGKEKDSVGGSREEEKRKGDKKSKRTSGKEKLRKTSRSASKDPTDMGDDQKGKYRGNPSCSLQARKMAAGASSSKGEEPRARVQSEKKEFKRAKGKNRKLKQKENTKDQDGSSEEEKFPSIAELGEGECTKLEIGDEEEKKREEKVHL